MGENVTARIPRRRVFHVHHGTPYHVENSFRGVDAAVSSRSKWIDLDCHVTSDGVLVITHWPRPMIHDGFFDPADVLHRGASVEELTWAQVQGLRTKDTVPYRISRADTLVPYALEQGLGVELEVKSSSITIAQLAALRAELTEPEGVLVKTLVSLPPAPWERLKKAHNAGFETILLVHERGVEVPEAFSPFIDFFRGHQMRFVDGTI